MKQKKIIYHDNGKVAAYGYMENGEKTGYWKWYRKDGSKLRTGYYVKGKRRGEWMKYDTNGKLIHTPTKSL